MLDTQPMEFLEGTHGTSQSRAASILASGFHPSLGMLGYGVYFFFKTNDGIVFARKYYRIKFDFGDFDHDTDKACVVLASTISVETNNLYDLDDPAFQEVIAEARSTSGIDRKDYIRLNKLFDLIFNTWVQKNSLTPRVCVGKIPLRWHYYKPQRTAKAILVIDLTCILATEIAYGPASD